MSSRPSRSCSSVALPLAATALLSLGCFQIGEADDAGPTGNKDGGIVDLTRDAGQYSDSGPPPGVDSGPPPGVDSGPPPGVDSGTPVVQILSFAADDTTLAFRSGTTLRYNTANAQRCAIEPDIGPVQLPSGTRYVEAGLPGESVTYTLTCEGNGGPESASLTLVTALVERVGNVTATSAAELAGLSSVNVITGNLTVRNVAGVSELSALEGLVRVDGHVFVLSNPALGSVDLPYLEEIGGALFVEGNPALSAFELSALERVGERLYVSRNHELPQAAIDGLVAQLASADGIGGPVMDYYNDVVSVLGSLNQLMVCTTDGQNPAFELDFRANGTVLGRPVGQVLYSTGTYTRFEQHLELAFDGVTSTASYTELEYDRVTRVTFPGAPGDCFLSGLPDTGVTTPERYRCPTGGGNERMEAELHPDGYAIWRNAPADGNGNARGFAGGYVIDGEWVYFAFPNGIRASTPNLRFPIARRASGTLDFPELPDGTSPCPAAN